MGSRLRRQSTSGGGVVTMVKDNDDLAVRNWKQN